MPAVDDWAAELRLAATPATVRAYLGAVRRWRRSRGC